MSRRETIDRVQVAARLSSKQISRQLAFDQEIRPGAKRTMSKGDQGPQRVEDDRRVDLSEVVQLSQELDGGDSSLIVLENVSLGRKRATSVWRRRELEARFADVPPVRFGCSRGLGRRHQRQTPSGTERGRRGRERGRQC